jgi:hypothetical protein
MAKTGTSFTDSGSGFNDGEGGRDDSDSDSDNGLEGDELSSALDPTSAYADNGSSVYADNGSSVYADNGSSACRQCGVGLGGALFCTSCGFRN